MTGFLAAAALWSSGALIFRNYLRLDIEEAWMAAGLCFFAQACWVVVLLAHLNKLYPAPIAAAEILIFLAQAAAILAWRIKRKFSRHSPSPNPLPKGEGIIDSLARKAGEGWGEGLLFSWPICIATIVFAAVLIARLLTARALPIAGWDALSYHLNIVFEWVKHGNLSVLSSYPERYFARNGELFGAWLAEISGARIEAARASQCLALPLLGLAAAAIARRLCGRPWMWPCALAVMAMPFAVIQSGIAYVDLLHAAFWLCSAASILCFERTNRKIYLALYALALGLSAGTKSTLYFEAALLIPLVWIYWSRPPLRRPILRLLPWLAALAFLGGGLTYLRNWIYTGNPLYPIDVRLGAWTLFHGLRTPESFRGAGGAFVAQRRMMLWYPFHETQSGQLVYSHITGAGPLFGVGWLFWPIALYLAWKKRDGGAMAFLSLCPAVVFLFEFVHPTPEMRYIMFLPPLLILGLAYALSQAGERFIKSAFLGWSLAILWCAAGAFSAFGRDALWCRQELAKAGRIDAYDFYVHQYGPLGQAWKFLGPKLQPQDVVATNADELTLPWAGAPPRAELDIINYGPTMSNAADALWLARIMRRHVRYFGLVEQMPWEPQPEMKAASAINKFHRLFKPLGEWSSADSSRPERIVLYEVSQPAPAKGKTL